uniref:hypothetical protein n=1 Tax=Kocuria rosea TaxID=1275 RepID=UPI001643D9DC
VVELEVGGDEDEGGGGVVEGVAGEGVEGVGGVMVLVFGLGEGKGWGGEVVGKVVEVLGGVEVLVVKGWGGMERDVGEE